MADRGDTHYKVSNLNAWFFFSSVLLFVACAWMMIDDWDRPWKNYQREFREIELEIAEAEREELVEEGALETEAELHKAKLAAEQVVSERSDDIAAVEEELRLARGVRWDAIEQAKKAKSQFAWDRYIIEEERLTRADPTYRAKDLMESELEMNTLISEQQVAEAKVAEFEQRLKGLRADLETATKALSAGTRELDMVRKRIDALAPEDPKVRIANALRDAPGLNFVGPSLQVKKTVLENLTFELNFTKKTRIDMCMTCHLGIESDLYQDQEQPYTSHPRLDLYLSSKSPHPTNQVGCTICHRGSGEALDFIRVDHRPETKEQQAEWEEEHHWHKQHHWDYPMLAESKVEASCVQCHKTSMELIAEDAPTVSEGYRLAERYGCYSCHKIDWFPTKRRPGPNLKNMQSKVTPEWLTAWISNPKDFRPTTWMPQIFHLENYAADETVVTSEYGQGRAIKGDEWDEAAVDAVAAYLIDRAPEQAYPPLPVEGDAIRGAEVMRVVGCYACHNTAPWGGEEPLVNDLALEARGTNEHGPNLRGVATKVNAEWLFAWLKDPQAYWSETRMPNLRLSDQDAADITAYMMEDPEGIFTDVPETWTPAVIEMDPAQELEVLGEQARWYFSRLGRTEVEARLRGDVAEHRWNDLQTLKVAVGERVVGNYGCFSCHEISGMEDMMPIGVELSNWGSKEVAKLDFGFGVQEFGLDGIYREGWLLQKLHAPRSFDHKKVKNPTEKLRMPWFNFTEQEAEALTTFVIGLVDDEVQRAKMVPDAGQLAMDAGMRAVRQNNCMSCHMIDPGTVTYQAEDGRIHTVAAELLGVGDEALPPEHSMAALMDELDYQETDEVGFRVLRAEPEPGLTVGDKVFVERDDLLALEAPKGGDLIRLITSYYLYGQELYDAEAEDEDDAYYSVTADPEEGLAIEDVDGTFRDHTAEPYDKLRWTFAPPVLWNEGAKVQKDWFFGFLHDVATIRPPIRVRMPSFHFQEGEAEGIASYFAEKSRAEWPANYTRELRLALGLSAEQLADLGKGLSAQMVRDIEAGSKPDIAANFSKVLAVGAETGFQHPVAVDPDYEVNEVRSNAYLAARASEEPNHLKVGERIATESVNCFQCHFRLGDDPGGEPIAWAPDMAKVHDRLREDWVRTFLTDPGKIYPGTAMPANFTADPPQYQDVYPDSTNPEQIRVVLEWVMNFDRVYLGVLAQ